MTTPRTRRHAAAPDAVPDAGGLTPAQRAALHQVYRLILTFAHAEPEPAPVPSAHLDRQPDRSRP